MNRANVANADGRFAVNAIVLLAVMSVAGTASAQDYPAKPIRFVVSAATGSGTVLAALSSGAAQPQPYPTKSVRLIVGFAAGGGTDVIARILAAKLSELWGQQAVVENRTGAGGNIGAEIAAKAAPDGYTLYMCGIATHGIGPSLYKKLPYDPIKDFAPITQVGTTPNVMVVHPSLPAKSVSEFIVYAKANPRSIHYGSAGVGSTLHMSMELFRAMTGVDVVHVPYKGGALALADLLGGHVQVMIDNLPGQLAMIKAARTRALGVTTARRNAQLPEVPTIAEAGVPGYEVTVWVGVCAPAATPKPVLAKLNADAVKALGMADLQSRMAESGVDTAPTSPEAFAQIIKTETARWAKVVKEAGIAAE